MQNLKVIGQLTAFEVSLYYKTSCLSQKRVGWAKEVCFPIPSFFFFQYKEPTSAKQACPLELPVGRYIS